MVPPTSEAFDLICFFPSLYHSVNNPITLFSVFINSEEFAFLIFNTFRENSITASCNPRQIPKKGTLFKRAYFIAFSFPVMPLSPKPPGTIIPLIFCSLELRD